MNKNEYTTDGSVWRRNWRWQGPAEHFYARLDLHPVQPEGRLTRLNHQPGAAFFELGVNQPEPAPRQVIVQELEQEVDWEYVASTVDRAKVLALDWELRRLADVYDAAAIYYREQLKLVADVPVELLRLHIAKGEPFDLRVSHPMVVLMARQLADYYEQQGGPNYASFSMRDERTATAYEVVVRPLNRGAKMPAELAAELRGELAETRAELDKIKASQLAGSNK